MESRKVRVLVVDDERVLAQTMAMIIEQSGYISKAVYSGEDAVATAREFEPDIVVSDVIMLGMTGIEAAIEIRQFCPKVRVFIYSSSRPPSYLLEKAEGQEFTYLTTPFPPKYLLELLAEHQPE